MYVPAHFEENRVEVLHEAIRRAGLATLVTLNAGGLVASHIPMLLDPAPAPFGTLRGHLARANPQWKDVAAATPALAIFMGPDAYISPALYPTKKQTGKVVPTWNYVAVHATGPLRFFEDADSLLKLVTALTQRHEATRREPWAVSDAPPDYIQSMLRAIVGFEIPIASLEGKWKMSQNRTAEDRTGVAEKLAADGGRGGGDVAAIVAERSK
jgi:transcriptional regulator